MPNQNLQIFIVILGINVMMSSIRSSSCFDVNVPGVNNENKKSAENLFVYSPRPSLDGTTTG